MAVAEKNSDAVFKGLIAWKRTSDNPVFWFTYMQLEMNAILQIFLNLYVYCIMYSIPSNIFFINELILQINLSPET